MLKFDPNHRFFSPCDFEIWCMTLKNYRAHLLYYIKLCVSFQIHRWIQIDISLRKRSIRVEIGEFLSLVTLKFDLKTQKGTSSILLQALCIISQPSVNSNWSYSQKKAQFGSKLTIVLAVWLWNLMDDLQKQLGTSSMLLQALCSILYPLVNSNWSYSPETPNLGQIRQFVEPCDLEIWEVTLQNNRAPLLCYF